MYFYIKCIVIYVLCICTKSFTLNFTYTPYLLDISVNVIKVSSFYVNNDL